MFDFKRKIQSTSEPSVSSEEKGGKTAPLAAKPAGFDASGVKVHIMPEKFLTNSGGKVVNQPTGKTTNGKILGLNKNIFIGLVIGLVVIGTVSLAGWFLLKSLEAPANTNLLVNQNVVKEQPLANVVPKEETTPTPELPVSVCSPENCGLCAPEECANLSETCHL